MSRSVWPNDFPSWKEYVESQLDALAHASQLGNSSIESGRVTIYQDDTLRGIIGTQFDDTVTALDFNGPPPPAPDPPTAVPIPQGFVATWDGTFLDGAVAPSDFAKVQVYVSTDLLFASGPGILAGTILSAAGGKVIYAAPDYSTYAVRFVAVSTSGTPSTPSDSVTVTPEHLDGVDIADLSLTVLKFHTLTHLLY